VDTATTTRLLAELATSDENVRAQAALALAELRTLHPEVTIDAALFERLMEEESARVFSVLADRQVLVAAGALGTDGVLSRALEEKRERAMDGLFRILALVHPPADVAAVRAALKTTSGAHSSAVEYIDNLLPRALRSRILVLVEDIPDDERVERGASLYRAPARAAQEIVAELGRPTDEATSVP
jgi:hypothetical protein